MSYIFSIPCTPANPISIQYSQISLLAEMLASQIAKMNHYRVSTSGPIYCYTQNRWAICFPSPSEFESGLYTAIMTAANQGAIIVLDAKNNPVPTHHWIKFVSSSAAKYLLRNRDTDNDAQGGLIEQQLLSSPWVGFSCGIDLRWDAILCDYEMEPACPSHYVMFRHDFACPTRREINDFDKNLPQLFTAQIQRLFGSDPRNANVASAYLGAIACSAHTRKMLNIEGPSGIGKSVLAEIAEAMIPRQCRTAIPLGHENTSDFDFESVATAKLITVHEVGTSKISNSETVKALITGNPVTINRKGKSRLTIESRANMIVVSNQALVIDSKGDPKSTAARILILHAQGSCVRDTSIEIERYGSHVWNKEGRQIMIYVLGMWRWAASNSGFMWREWTEPAREAALESAYDSAPDLRWIHQSCEVTGHKNDKISMIEFSERYRIFRDLQGRSTLEYGPDHARKTWSKFGIDGTKIEMRRTNMTINGVTHKNIYCVYGVRWVEKTEAPAVEIHDLM